MEKLTDKVAIITGAGRGIGSAIARVLAYNGAKVVVADILPERDEVAANINSMGLTALALKVDVTDTQGISRAVHEVVEKFGGIDILVNNAAIFARTSIDEMTREEWDKVIEVNLTGVFNWTKEVLPIMKRKGYGRIINISSAMGPINGFGPFAAHYSASKAGVVGFTRSAALDGAPHGITVNAICPGMIATEYSQSFHSKEQIEKIISRTPMKRMGKPEEVA